VTTPEPPAGSRTARRETNRHRNRRLAIIAAVVVVVLAAGGAAALVLRDDGDNPESPSKGTKSTTTTTTAAAATSVPETAAADPAACLRGSFQFVSQVYSAPVNTVYGPTNIEGGVGGRTIELRPDGTFHFEDTGRDKVDFELLSTAPPTTGTAVLKATAEGAYTADAASGTFDVTQLAGTLTLTLADGQVIDVPTRPGSRRRSA